MKLELRHQRTSDVMFELVDKNSNDIYGINKVVKFIIDNESLMNYVYHMIETLLPKANYDEEEKDF